MKAKLIRWLAEWLFRNHKYLLEEIVIGHGYHRHKNGKRKPTAVVNFPREVSDGK